MFAPYKKDLEEKHKRTKKINAEKRIYEEKELVTKKRLKKMEDVVSILVEQVTKDSQTLAMKGGGHMRPWNSFGPGGLSLPTRSV